MRPSAAGGGGLYMEYRRASIGLTNWGRRVVALIALMAALPVQAQSTAGAGVNDPGTAPVIDRERADRVEPRIAPPPALPPTPAPQARIAAPAAAPATRLSRVLYAGSSLPAAMLDRAVAPLIGRPITRETLQDVAKAISAAYARSDVAFHAVTIPAQVPAEGRVIVQLVEGRVKDFQLAGLWPDASTRLIEAQMRRVTREAPLRKSTLERALGLLRDVPGQTVDARVRQTGGPGELTLDLIVKRKQLRIRVLIDNSGVSNVVDGVQAQLSVTANGLLREGDSTRISGYLPFYPDRYQYYALSHSTPIDRDGLSLSAQAAHVESRQRGGMIEGEATTAGVGLSYALVRSNRTNLSISASVDGIDSSNYFLDVRFGDYRSRALRLGGTWSRTEAKSGHALSAVVSRGIDILGAKPFAGFSEAAFTKVNAQAVVVETLSKRISIKLSARGQYSRDRLPVTERFALGGRGAGMAFQLGARTAEQAVAGSAELIWSPPTASPLLKNSAFFLYADGAWAHEVARPAYRLSARNYSLASAGGGVRLALGPQWRASAEVAAPVKRLDNRLGGKPRFFFGLGRAF